MKKKLIVFIFLVAIILVIVNGYKCKTTGNQNITITTAKTAYSNSDLYVSIVTDGKGITNTNQEKIKLKLLNSKGHKVKNVDVSYSDDGYTGIIKIPDVEAGNYTIEAYVSSNKGKDTVQKDIYISDGKQENITITLDKGIYKPGDTVNFRALLTDNINDEPIEKDTNVAIYDGNDNKVYNENVTTSEYGILSGKFVIADEVNSGIYKIVVKTNTREFTKEFKVNPYITPKYEINIETDKPKYQIGENVKININSKYFFGEAVSGAKYTVYINGEKYQSPVADENGNTTVTYHNVKNVGKYTVKVEAVDSSNYFVEKTSEFTVSSGAFEIQFIPEFGSLLKGQKNKIYVFTKSADGLPVKTYVTVYSNGQTKQIATDENGIGMFEYSSDENAKNVQFQVTAENMQGEKIEKKISLTQISTYTMISTDKVKYNQGEDIKININQTTFGTKNIIMMKNNRIIKQITTDSNEISVKLDDIYGLVDIYVTDAKSNIQKYNQEIFYMTNNTSSLSSGYKRTIFVKPNKALNIDINTDKQEYKPGDDIKISFKIDFKLM